MPCSGSIIFTEVTKLETQAPTEPTVIVTDLSEEERRKMEEERRRMAKEREEMRGEIEKMEKEMERFADERKGWEEERLILQGDLNSANKVSLSSYSQDSL